MGIERPEADIEVGYKEFVDAQSKNESFATSTGVEGLARSESEERTSDSRGTTAKELKWYRHLWCPSFGVRGGGRCM